MKIAVAFPTTEIGADAGAIREWTLGVEAMGYNHVRVPEHVLGANPVSRPDWKGLYDLHSMFHEPFTLMSFMAAITTKLGFVTSILILPQRQTVLVAKQAAEVDVLSKGRLRLGIGVGWNALEFEALGVSFAERGAIFEEQIGVLRELWTKDAVTLDLPYHTITDAGICPAPLQRPIPLWFGGGIDPSQTKPASEKVMRRIARLADGWMPACLPDDTFVEQFARFKGYCRHYGRNPDTIGLEVTMKAPRNSDAWIATAARWRQLGTTYLGVNTMGDGLNGADQHLRRLEEVRPALFE